MQKNIEDFFEVFKEECIINILPNNVADIYYELNDKFIINFYLTEDMFHVYVLEKKSNQRIMKVERIKIQHFRVIYKDILQLILVYQNLMEN